MRSFSLVALCAIVLAVPAFSKNGCTDVNIKDTILKHLKTSEAFSLNVAEAMPEANFGFKLTPPQMSFGEQFVHLSQGFEYFTSPFSGERPNPLKPASMSKSDIIAFVKLSYERTIAKVSQLTPEQIAKDYQSEEGNMTGFELLLGLMEHTTHHRACAEMYLRSKGITLPEYAF
jgi:uncharacterized damage-inducible protein DinB